ncbi:MAG: hypothetical protein SF187_01685 [Deltaproteobacteria bacterium]|nr:hypothetical protein [Deltaproteobacteria bacterium]
MQVREERETVSIDRLAALLGGDAQGAQEILSLFLAEIPRYAQRFAVATSVPEFAGLVHRLRGSLLPLGLLTDAARLADIELDARSSTTIDGDAIRWIATLLPALAAETQQQLDSRGSQRTRQGLKP